MKTPVETALEYVTLPFPKLRDYQVEDINRLAIIDIVGLFLDMGLGKTVTSILIAIYKLATGNFYGCYVICPANLVTQWVIFLGVLGVKAVAYRGTPKQRADIDIDTDFIVMSYQIFQKDYAKLKRDDVYYIIDEATVLCNTGNLLYKMLMGGEIKKTIKDPGKIKPRIEKTTYRKIMSSGAMLTATPINKPEDAYGLIKIKSPDLYDNYNQFLRMHVAEFDYFDQPSEYQNLELLRDNLLVNASYRLVTDHIELPPIIFKTVWYELEDDHLKLYNQLLDEKFLELKGEVLIDALSAQALYNWAQKLILNPDKALYKKTPVGIELLDQAVASVRSYLIFNNYVMTNEQLMKRYNIGGVFGGVSPKMKEQYIADFKAGKLLGMTCHSKSGGIGLDLPMCQHVFMPELPITPRDFRQDYCRIYRPGQKETVVITNFVAKNTIQETLFNKIMVKDDLMGQVVRTASSLRGDLLSDVLTADKEDLKRTKQQLKEELKGGRK